MVSLAVLHLSPFKLPHFRSCLIQETKLSNFNLGFISTRSRFNVAGKDYNYNLFPTRMKKSFAPHCVPFNQYEVDDEVKKIRERFGSKSSEDEEAEVLIMVDTIQRLGLQHYFQAEIHAALQRHYAKFTSFDEQDDLHVVALTFRLLRQEGYNVTADVFEKFKNKEGKFKQENQNYNLKGLLSLFEACQLSMEGENIMDEAAEFSEQILKDSLMMNILEQAKATVIQKTLKSPFHRSLAKISSKTILKDYETSLELLHDLTDVRDWMKDVQNIARIDSNIAQIARRKELLQISRWGKELNLRKELHFARIQPLKWYIWSLGTLPGPNMAEQRIELAKSVSFIYMIDDIFDVYGTLDELSLFTQAVNRWEDADVDNLPNYMQVCFNALRDMVKNFSHRTHTLYGWNPQTSLQKAWGDLCKSFLNEAKWLDSGELPSSEEYLKNGITSVGVPVVLMHAFFLLGNGISQESVDALDCLPSIVSSSATIVRLWNDVGTDKDENRDGKDGSYTDCYMKEHKSVKSPKSARQHVNMRISDAWKRMNEECLSPSSPFPAEFKEACLNFARMASVMYSFDESHRLLDLQQHLNLSLKESPSID